MTAPDAEPFFLPWLGPDYAESGRLLVLGESHYSTTDRDERGLTRRVVKDYVDGKWTHRFWTLLARTIAGTHLAPEGCRALWNRVAFYNFVQVAVSGPRVRPTVEMWRGGSAPFQQVLRDLEPKRILVVGREVWWHMPAAPDVPFSRHTGVPWPARRYPMGATGALATFINHPASRGYRAERWADVVAALAVSGDDR